MRDYECARFSFGLIEGEHPFLALNLFEWLICEISLNLSLLSTGDDFLNYFMVLFVIDYPTVLCKTLGNLSIWSGCKIIYAVICRRMQASSAWRKGLVSEGHFDPEYVCLQVELRCSMAVGEWVGRRWRQQPWSMSRRPTADHIQPLFLSLLFPYLFFSSSFSSLARSLPTVFVPCQDHQHTSAYEYSLNITHGVPGVAQLLPERASDELLWEIRGRDQGVWWRGMYGKWVHKGVF